jgi:hypothetical protein
MPDNDRKKDEAPEERHPIDPPVSDDEQYRLKNAEATRDKSQTSSPADRDTESKD